MIGKVQLVSQLYKPWTIQDNDIHSKGIQSWQDRRVREADFAANSLQRRAHEKTLFEEYVASKIQLSTRFELLNITI